ncbi:helix-hairpin-helix domain-containing protein [Roseobacter weihaiensis]|uniref:helix-hairpin-helix domain-containing protein n=1 Tax=Roseobacter weihaiensis TaxID=2763262 RepID=UPI001D0ACD8C|nr:helix-hairpin-helix domain-containing protein [Roseobacter sp. H9]
MSGAKENALLAEKLAEVADLLEHQRANPFRVRAYRQAAAYIQSLTVPIRKYLGSDDVRDLEALPTIGPSIAAAIVEILQTGHLRLLETLRGEIDPEKLFQTVPQIGPHLAATIHDGLGIDSLEALEMAAHDGRLAALAGFGPRRIRGIQYALAEILKGHRPLGGARIIPTPPVSETLDVDRQYRLAADAGTLPLIAPRRFSADQRARLPVLHTERGDWHFTALYSNSPRAHRLHRERDWVVITYERDGEGSHRCTVVTEFKGPLAGKRVIRGHETACARHYGVGMA